tara:strand:+ start:958 stop:1248 length:291 start_codon:yes stop_codon:yes gene_type:complete
MNQFNSQKASILEKIQLIEAKVKSLGIEKQDLVAEIEDLQNTVKVKENAILKLEKQLNLTKIAKTISLEKEESKDIKKLINKYVREIDRCIAHLNE